MKHSGNFIPLTLISIGLFLFATNIVRALPAHHTPNHSLSDDSFQQANDLLNSIGELAPSIYWPNIKPNQFLENLKTNIHLPASPYQGRGTRFCGYGVLTFLMIKEDPLGYTKLLLKLYKEGKATYGDNEFKPSAAIKKAAGKIQFKGVLDIRPAEQMWYLCLADHFKGYLNIFNNHYHSGDEELAWASVNYAKFNRMLKKLLPYKVSARGTDLIRPQVGDLFSYLNEKLTTGTVILYINNRQVHKKNHAAVKFGIPTHYIVVEQIIKKDGVICLLFWDYGGKTLMEMSPSFLKKVTFGITHCTKPIANGS